MKKYNQQNKQHHFQNKVWINKSINICKFTDYSIYTHNYLIIIIVREMLVSFANKKEPKKLGQDDETNNLTKFSALGPCTKEHGIP